MPVTRQVDTLVHDERIPAFLERVRRLHRLPVSIYGSDGELYAACEGDSVFDRVRESPLSVWGKQVGVVRVGVPDGEEEKADEIARLVSMYAESILDAEYQMGSLAQEITEKYEEVNLLYDLSDELGALFDERKIGVTLLNRIGTIIPVGRASVFLLRDGSYVPVATLTPGPEAREATDRDQVISSELGVLGELTRKRKPILVTDENTLDAGVRESERFLPVDSFLAVPLIRSPEQKDETLLGAIVLMAKKNEEPFNTGDQKLVSAVASQASAAIYNARLVEELKDTERMKRDLELAREIHLSLLPKEAPVLKGVDLAGRCVTAQNIGGDYYSFVIDEDKSVSILIGDVTGHDLGSALLMSTARATLLAAVSESDNTGIVLERANRILYPDLTRANLLISLFVARLDLRTRKILFANGGHNPPLLLRATSDRPERLDADGLILGVQEDVEYDVGMRDLGKGDSILFYTDGIVEARSPRLEILGEERLCRYLVKHRHLPAQAIVDSLFDDAEKFISGERVKDDITLVVLKIT